jgi:hypothetical protein
VSDGQVFPGLIDQGVPRSELLVHVRVPAGHSNDLRPAGWAVITQYPFVERRVLEVQRLDRSARLFIKLKGMGRAGRSISHFKRTAKLADFAICVAWRLEWLIRAGLTANTALA